MNIGFSAHSWRCNFVDASVFSFSKKNNFFKICFRQGFYNRKGGLPMNKKKTELPQFLMIP